MDGDHPYKRVKYAFSASKSAVDLAISDGTKKSKEDVVDCLRVVLDSGTELLESLKEAREYDLQLQEKASRKELAEKRQRECKETILKLTKSEHKLCDLILKGSGEDPFCLRNDPVPSTKRLRTVILDDLVAYSQKISYSTAAPPVTPPTAIVYMPHSLAMRCSTLYYPVPGLSDPNHPFMEELRQQQLLQQQQQQEQERLRQQQHQQKIKQEDIAVELDLDLGDGEDSSLDSDSSSDEGDDEDDDKMDEWDIE